MTCASAFCSKTRRNEPRDSRSSPFGSPAGRAVLSDFDNGEVLPMGDGSMGGRNAMQRVLGHISNKRARPKL